MKHFGHIEIRDKVIFVYYELEKPDPNVGDFVKHLWYQKAMEEYHASKREVEVSSVGETSKGKWVLLTDECGPNLKLEHNQPCEAKVKNGKAEITKIL